MEAGHESVIAELIERSAAVNHKNKSGETPLDVANIDSIKNLLVQKGAKNGASV